ncbi:MAG: monovalent cation/H+ antiporter complex subunit F [Gammaproteobacteria bacterium]
MAGFLSLSAIVLALSLSLGLVRVFRGPSMEDRLMSAQLVGTTGVGMLLLFATLLDMPSSIDVALVLALLAAVSVAALTRQEDSAKANHD